MIVKNILNKFMAESAKTHNEHFSLIKEIRASTDATIKNQGALIKALEIQIEKMSKVLQEKGSGSLPTLIETNPRDHVKSITTTEEAETLKEWIKKAMVELIQVTIPFPNPATGFENKSLESSNNHFKEANNELSKTNQLMFKDLKKFQAELDKYNDVNYASKVEIDCAKAKRDLMSYKIDFEKSSNAYTQKINDLNQTILDMKKELCAHQETISIMSQAKEAQIKLYKTREDKELDKVIALENKVKVLNDIVYKTGQSVQTMNMLNRNCKTSFAKPEFLKKAQRANPRLYDIGCYNDNLALMLAPDSDKTIRLDKERRSKLSNLIKPFDYDQLNNLYDLFVPQREKSAEQHYFPKTPKMSHTSFNKEFSKETFRKQTTLFEKRMDESIPWDQKTVKFGNDQIAPILGYGDLVQGTITIKRVYYVEGALLITIILGSRSTDLYSITLQDSTSPNPICLMAKAKSSQAWLWHRRLSYLNFDTINLLLKNNIVNGFQMASDHVSFDPDSQCSTTILGQDSLSPSPQSQENVPQVAETVTTLKSGYCYYVRCSVNLLNGNSPVVSKVFAVHAVIIPININSITQLTLLTSTDVADPPH
ncbi:integrase, catalytic region, zinc finger, CCHC-type containing protein [Tanacetum coccineum]